MKRHIDSQKPYRHYQLRDGFEYPYGTALCGQGAYICAPPNGDPTGQWADEDHAADCVPCLRALAKMDPEEAEDCLSVRRELEALAKARLEPDEDPAAATLAAARAALRKRR